MTTTNNADLTATRRRFRALHESGTFILPNPFDVGSARLLQHMGFEAIATTSSGLAASMGRLDGTVTLDELVNHVFSIAQAVTIPINVDAERGYAESAAGVTETIDRLAAAGASGISIEDWNPSSNGIDPLGVATERVAVAAAACRRHGVLLTGRAENYLHGIPDLDDTITRLRAYRDAGAEAVYAPAAHTPADVERIVRECAIAVNVLSLPGSPSVPDLTALGVRRVSTGGALAWAAYGGLVAAASELRDHGTNTFLATAVPSRVRNAAFG
jgi:2-methylisocitrate lyase-like PEP mutase family enzyme